MRKIISIALGFVAFFFVVFRPMHANLLASIARQYPISFVDKAMLLNQASEIDACNGDILNSLGDAYITIKNPIMGTIAYGKAISCSPGNSLMRFKFGESLLILGFIEGKQNITEARTLEPSNPIYKTEYDRITELQLQLR